MPSAEVSVGATAKEQIRGELRSAKKPRVATRPNQSSFHLLRVVQSVSASRNFDHYRRRKSIFTLEQAIDPHYDEGRVHPQKPGQPIIRPIAFNEYENFDLERGSRIAGTWKSASKYLPNSLFLSPAQFQKPATVHASSHLNLLPP